MEDYGGLRATGSNPPPQDEGFLKNLLKSFSGIDLSKTADKFAEIPKALAPLRRLDPQYEETAETIRQQGVERDKRGQRRQAARMGTATNVSPDRRQSRTGTGSVPGNPPRKRQEQYKPGLQRRQRGALGDQSIFRQRQTPRRRAASSAGEG